NAVVDDRTLHEIYMPAFAAAITEAGVGSVMCSYNEVNGVQACNNRDLLTTALKREMGLPGFVISDWYGTHDTVQSANAGLDMEMPGGTFFGAALKKAVLAGSVSTATVDDKVVRILLEMFRFGLFDHPKSGEADAVVTSPEHLALARDVAAAGTVLLKN